MGHCKESGFWSKHREKFGVGEMKEEWVPLSDLHLEKVDLAAGLWKGEHGSGIPGGDDGGGCEG